jgi:hypothetical protein
MCRIFGYRPAFLSDAWVDDAGGIVKMSRRDAGVTNGIGGAK